LADSAASAANASAALMYFSQWSRISPYPSASACIFSQAATSAATEQIARYRVAIVVE